MRTIVSALFLCLLTSLSAWAQTGGRITGQVQEAGNKTISGVSASLYKVKDSALVKVAVTDKNGHYEFVGIKEGQYRIVLTSVGFERKSTAAFDLSENGTVQVPVVILTESAKGLSGVTVQSKRPFVETKLDKTVVNVDASPTSAGSSALEILEKSPGIMVNSDGAISLRGKQGVIIMLDGKPTYLSASDLTNLLKNMPASALDQIEIMTNPSSKYDASGNSGIINIKTKKGKTAGFNGSVTLGATTTIYNINGETYNSPRSQNSFNFNYRKNKWNFFGNYNPNMFSGRNTQEIYRKNYDTATKEYLGYTDQIIRFKFGNLNHTLKLGADFYADKKNTFGVVVSGFSFDGSPRPRTTSEVRDPNGNLSSGMNSYTNNEFSSKNFTSNFNWRHQFDSTGKEITTDIDYVKYSNGGDMLLETNPFDANRNPAAALFLRGNLPSHIDIVSVKSDFVKPYKNGRIEAGVKSSYVKTDNLVEYEYFANNKWNADNRSNHFVYEENINAAYVNGNRQFKKWTLQGGLRLENTIATGNQVTTKEKFSRDRTSLFPSAFVSYDVNKDNKLTTSYGRRINRPSYQNLNPFLFFADSLTYQKGNPYLKPQYSNNIELTHVFKGKFITTLAYNNTTDVIAQILKPDGVKMFNTFDNVAKQNNISLSLTVPVKVTKWWNANFFSNVFNNNYEGIYNNKPFDVSNTSFSANISNNFTLGKGLTGEISGFYRHDILDQITYLESFYQMSLGLQQQVIKGKGTVRLNVRDPFQWQRFKGYTQFEGIDMTFHNRPDSRSVTATFTYRFGKSTPQNQPRRRSTSSQEEQSRVGQGGQ
jgi:outer membrane receptor protein involved in Fe transport